MLSERGVVMTPRPPAAPPRDPLLEAYAQADGLLGSGAPQPAEAVRDRVLAAALAAGRTEAPAVAPVPQRAGSAANTPRWRWAAVAASVCTVSLATLVALRVQMESPPEEFAREAPVAATLPAPAQQTSPAEVAPAPAPGTAPAEAAAADTATAPHTPPAAAGKAEMRARKAAAEADRERKAQAQPAREREAEAAQEKETRGSPPAPAAAIQEAAPAPQRSLAAPADAVPAKQRDLSRLAEPTAPAPAAPVPPARREAATEPAAPATPTAQAAATPNPRDAAGDNDTRQLRQSSPAFAGAAAPALKAQQAPAQRAGAAAANAALLQAAEAGDAGTAKQAIAAGADRQALNAALHTAAERGHLEVLRTVLAAGADVTSLNRYGGTALIPASHYGHVAIVRELLLHTRVDRNHVNSLGWTALLEAVLLGDGGPRHTEIVKLLLAHGADPNIADRAGVTPLQHARQRGYAAIAQAIEAAGGR